MAKPKVIKTKSTAVKPKKKDKKIKGAKVEKTAVIGKGNTKVGNMIKAMIARSK